jgi:hypothetical protein
MSVNDWIREFKDYCRGRNLLGIIMGTEPRGSFTSQDHENRRRLAFSAICDSMKSHPTIYKSKMLDDFRNESDPDPHVVITKVMGLLRPRDVDSRMTIMMNINQLKFQEGETIFDLIPRYNGLVANLPDSEQPDESTKFLHLKMAITSNPKTREAYRNSIETLEIQAADYETVCQALVAQLSE